jgi:tetratricopeptide (TPR) repeat protein
MALLQVGRAGRMTRNGFLSTILDRLPGAWIHPTDRDLVSLYRMRYRMAMDEGKYDTALIFLNKILEVDPRDLEAKLSKGEIFHRHLNDYGKAVDQYNRLVKLTSDDPSSEIHARARASMAEILELLS